MFFKKKFHFTVKDFIISYEEELEWIQNQSEPPKARDVRFCSSPILYEYRDIIPDVLKILIGYASFHANTTIIKLQKFRPITVVKLKYGRSWCQN